MSIFQFILKSIRFYRRQHLAVFVGVLISTAVLTGALVVGDSVNYSLKRIVNLRLANIKYAMQTGDRFVRSQLAEDISEYLNTSSTSLLMLSGVCVNPDSELRVNQVQVNGINTSFNNFFDIGVPVLDNEDAMISKNIADELGLEVGQEFVLRVEDAGIIPLEAPFSQDSKASVVFRLTVKDILDDDRIGRFSLKSIQAAPFNVFLSSRLLEEELNLNGLCNTILVSDVDDKLTLGDLNYSLEELWTFEDASLKTKELENQNNFEIISQRIFIDDYTSDAIIGNSGGNQEILTYLVNSIHTNENETPYSFVSAVSSPLVPDDLKEDEIIINQWLAEDLEVGVMDTIVLDYYIIGPMRTLSENSYPFIIRSIISTDNEFINNSLMPEYPGLHDALSCRDWETGIPIDLEKIREKDEEYWIRYKGTPKALISLHQGINLWENDYGKYTAIRIVNQNISKQELEKDILEKISPHDLNLVFTPVYQQGIDAADNSVDFGELFLSLSFFVIVAGVLLTLLLYGLQTESRREETGVLGALGFSKNKIIRIRFLESLFIATLGGVAGVGLGLLYNFGLTAALNTIWQDAVKTNMLVVFVKPQTLLIGAVSGTILAAFSILIVTYRNLKKPLSGILKDEIDYSLSGSKQKRTLNLLLILIGLLGSFLLVVYSFYNSVEMNSGLFLTAGALFILGAVAFISRYISSPGNKSSIYISSLFGLASKNAGRNKKRTISTITLLALGVFTIIITGANRKTFYGVENIRSSGTGGFIFWAETAMPIIQDMNTEEGRSKLGLENEKALQEASFLQFNSLDGDDASCLNLNQVQNPRILGIDAHELHKRDAFSFANLSGDGNILEPWLVLDKEYPNGVIPAIADQTVITWGLKKKIGDTLHYLNEKGENIKLVLVGGLSNSIFQGNVLISKNAFRENFPSASGSKIMLIDGSESSKSEIEQILVSRLKDYGVDLFSTTKRLAEFNSVENTYLSVFMALGGLGVIIGTIGLGIVLVRNMIERKREIALLLAIGFQRSIVLKLIFIENLFVLLAGVLVGILAALIGILPSLVSPSFTIPGTFMIWLIIGVLLSGMIWIWIPASRIIKMPLMRNLRNE